ncbi:MAG TPA: hypothetical protein PK926_14415 [Spirochaetota bacterium]|nr:hypothetical protein [Spirochaetota bacterium]HPI91183.1 hypothetical protein [Spirochaetota bacterium]HPR49471.1 hypothetical protein [Spirochaetota bacterium]
MTLAIKYNYSDEILFITVEGEFSLESAQTTFLETLGHLDEIKGKKILIDCRSIINLSHDTITIYKYVTFVEKELKKRSLYPKIVYLHNRKNMNEIQIFAEDVAVNRGIIGRVFDDYETALSWLKNNV